ncbi:hypothetical protein IV203_037030 [Nitzschia inconspicua]|uniref:Uncharacterized protein n=1 Tax=Nitzschia inconspicua TaxID=303405 RepID=A0A9K3LK11_9STRA|nr:hypothetical protein IV203_037030 [Nitzschia inconspicua]
MEKLFVGLIPTAPDNFPTGICRQWVGDQVVVQPSETSVIYIQTCQQQYNCNPSLHELLESQLSSTFKLVNSNTIAILPFMNCWNHSYHHHHHHGMRKNLVVKAVIVFWGTTVLVDSCPALTTTIKSIKSRRTGRTGNRHKNKQGVNTPWGGTFSTAIVPVIDPAEWHTGPYCQVYIAACESATRRGLFQRDRKRWTAAGATAGGRDEDDAKCTASIDGTTREMTDTTDVSTNQMLLP